ncbi:UDP-glucuronosyltransferase 2A2-like isoform X2 [Antennarius striatus]|uniref:UDP-glucuronosyltransferase 2A2-like isoform X2 n=1 Tax=Antennarius striatus TaxID=241820 RepID=UPI0035B32FE2
MLLLLCMTWSMNGENVLVWYTEGSHWINMKPVLEKLIDRGHQVTVLVPSSSLFMNASEPARFHYEPFNVSVSVEVMEAFMEEFLHFLIYEVDNLSYLQIFFRFMELVNLNFENSLKYLDGVLKSDTIMKRLKERNNNWERHCGQVPAPPSFVPGAMSKLTDKMNFLERVWNFIFYATQDLLLSNTYWNRLDEYYSKVRGTPTSACGIMGRADMWLIRTYWDFNFPRPFLPNFKFVGGIHCRPAKPLPEDMEEFVQSSGDAGIVVFSLGSYIKNISSEKGNIIASALAQIPQKVLWKYSGEKPKSLAVNTRTYSWIPQNDLLGHPKTRAFITHGGANGIFEAIYHGVPMVGIPLFADQPENMIHMKARGAATILDLNSLKSEDLRDAINAVINDKSYKESVMRLSAIHHDRPVSPLDEAVFWIEFTMRNKGAKHLRVQAHELTWYQYHSLDVLVFLLTVILALILLFIKTCTFCLWRCCGRTGKTKTKTE